MYELLRETRLIGCTADRRSFAWVDRGIRVYLLETHGLTVDSRWLKQLVSAPHARRAPQVTFQLAGAITNLRYSTESELLDGFFEIEPSLEWAEIWSGRSFRALVLEWNADWGSLPASLSLSKMDPSMFAAAQAVALAILQRNRREVVESLAVLYSRLRAFGLDLAPWSANRLTIPDPKHLGVTRVLNELRTNLAGQAGWLDGATVGGKSERQLRRDLNDFYRSLDHVPESFRRRLLNDRLSAAVSLLSSKEPSIERVARSVGYGSSRALSLALRSAGLPPPSEIVAHARRLRG